MNYITIYYIILLLTNNENTYKHPMRPFSIFHETRVLSDIQSLSKLNENICQYADIGISSYIAMNKHWTDYPSGRYRAPTTDALRMTSSRARYSLFC